LLLLCTKIKWTLLIAFSLIIVSGCEGGEEVKKPQTQKEKVKMELEEIVEEMPAQGSPEVWITGKVIFEDGDIKVKGKSNLLPGSKVRLRRDIKGYQEITFGRYPSTTVEEDGSFVLDGYGYGRNAFTTLEVKFIPEDQDEDNKEIIETYGERGENLEGPFRRKYEYDDGEIAYEIINKVEYVPGDLEKEEVLVERDDEDEDKVKDEDKEDEKKEVERKVMLLEKYEWEKPDDYGDAEVWIEPEAWSEGRYIYVSAESNLLEGARVRNSVDLPGYIAIGGSPSSSVNVKPDGSFYAVIRNPGKSEQYINITFEPEDSWEHIQEHYGKKGENLEGDLVDEDNGEKRIRIEGLEIEEVEEEDDDEDTEDKKNVGTRGVHRESATC